MKKYFVISALMIAVIASGISEAAAQSTRDTNNRIKRLENEVQTLSRAIFRGEQPPVSAPNSEDVSPQERASYEVRLQQLETEMRNLTGLYEQQNYKLRQIETRLEQATAEFDQRVSALDGQTNTANTNRTPPISNTAGRPLYKYSRTEPSTAANTNSPEPPDIPGVSRLGTITRPADSKAAAPIDTDEPETPSQPIDKNADPSDIYQDAFVKLRDKNYDDAEKLFKSFIDNFPDHSLTPNARYWLGETYYVRNNYERAARLFAQAYQLDPEGSKAPDNLLKLALSLAGTGNKSDACLTLEQIKTQFKKTTTPINARVDREKENLGCE